MNSSSRIELRNGEAIGMAALPCLSLPAFREAVIQAVAGGARIAALFAAPGDHSGPEDANMRPQRLIAVLADDREGTLSIVSAEVREQYAALTPDCPQAHGFEREIAEQSGIKPAGHPWLKPIRFQRNGPVGVTDFFRVDGEEIHEVAVGPVHAGIIEPGHFRFQCHGEQVLHLEISLGYQHRGIERALIGGPHPRTIHHMETLAGDTTIGHALAYCHAVESLSGCRIPARAQALRAVALELERLSNHTGDLGALAGYVGFLPTSSFCGRLRGDFLNMTAMLCGSRFGRGFVRPGGIAFDVDATLIDDLRKRLVATFRDVSGAMHLLWETPSVMGRFENTGVVSLETATDLGLVGPAARACGREIDVRRDFPSGIYRFAQLPISTMDSGDVFARAFVRWMEIQRSVDFISRQLADLPAGAVRKPCGRLAPDSCVVSLQEGWRGEIVHVAMTDAAGRFARYKVVDSSFHNWMGLVLAMRNQEISDFPLCNKSFNLSYCGHDL